MIFAISSQVHAQIINFESDIWDLSAAEQTEFLGKKCVVGRAFLKGVEFENGIIEADIAVTGERSYPGIVFRKQNELEYERFYIRPHLSKTMHNVLQYVACFNGIDSWQLYNGEGYTASTEIPANQWFHLKIEIKDTQAKVFIDNDNTPALFIKKLAHEKSKGTIGIIGPSDGTAYFANFSYQITDNLEFTKKTQNEILYGFVQDWEISQVYKLSNVDVEKTPTQQGITDIAWKKIQSLSNGLVDISRYYQRNGYTPDLIWAKTNFTSDKDEIKKFAFGYSDVISIFLNGKVIFTGNSSYMSRDANFQGIVGLNDWVYLPLKKGKNELLIAVGESFGGWGFIFRDATAIYQHKSITKIWEKQNKLKYPESVVFDAKRNCLYISNLYTDGKECISKMNLNGEIEKFDWITGVMQPTGMCISNDKLYVVARFALIEIDLNSESISNRYRFPEPIFPNDVTTDNQGNIYITDNGKNVILKFSDGKFETWISTEEIKQPNGILFDKDKILVGCSGEGSLKSIDLATKKITLIAEIGEGSIMDGIKSEGNGNYLISDYNGRIFRINQSGTTELLMNTKSSDIKLADFEYIIEKQLMIIPTLEDNRIMCFKINN